MLLSCENVWQAMLCVYAPCIWEEPSRGDDCDQ